MGREADFVGLVASLLDFNKDLRPIFESLHLKFYRERLHAGSDDRNLAWDRAVGGRRSRCRDDRQAFAGLLVQFAWLQFAV